MKTFVIGATVIAAVSQLPTTFGWWDNGHMLVGEVASQLMAKEDVETIHNVLKTWDSEFPNTNELFSAAIWPDLIKCKTVSAYCASPKSPSFTTMDEWHYIDLPVNVNGSKFSGVTNDMDLFKYNLGGNALVALENSLVTMSTTKSTWAVNLVIRNFIHIFGDIHQPLHAVGGVSDANPQGDQGGNYYKFKTPCGFSNLHGLWDSAGGVYSTTNWAPNTDSFRPDLTKNASQLAEWVPLIADAINLEPYKKMSYSEFASKVKSDKIFNNVILESVGFASNVVYSGLDLTYGSQGTVACPPESYVNWAGYVAQLRIAVAGKRLAVFMTQFAKQIRALGLSA